MEDSHGVRTSGTLIGRLQYFGEYDQCKGVRKIEFVDGRNVTLKGQYTFIYLYFHQSSISFAWCATPKCYEFMKKAVLCKLIPFFFVI